MFGNYESPQVSYDFYVEYHLKSGFFLIISIFIKELFTRLHCFKTFFFVTNRNQLQFLRHEFLNNYKLHNHKFRTKLLLTISQINNYW